MKKSFGILIPLIGLVTALQADNDQNALVVTASNAAKNQLLVFNSGGKLIQTVSTQGQGGAGGNAGGIEAKGNLIAVVNFGSQSVSLFERKENGFQMTQSVPTVTNPVSVAFGNDHLYVLGATQVESHRMFGSNVNSKPDGVVNLLLADGSAAQVGVVEKQLIVTEKGSATGTIETVNLSDGAVSGFATMVTNIPADPKAPFGLVTRGNDAYVTIAHSNQITLVRKGAVLTVTGSGTQNAPCWLSLVGPFLYSSNSPSMSISRYAVHGQKIVQEEAVAASLNGNPTDIASGSGLVAVIDTKGHLSIFSVDEDGGLTLLQTASSVPTTGNGVAIVPDHD